MSWRGEQAARAKRSRITPTVLVVALNVAMSVMSSLSSAQTTRPVSFVDAATVVPKLAVEMRYHGSHNFIGRPVDGYERPVCLLTRQASAALAQVQRSLAPQGLGLKVFDCYRPVRATKHFLPKVSVSSSGLISAGNEDFP